MTPIEALFAERASPAYRGHADMVPHMQTLSAYARMCTHCTEFGVRTGSSTVALLHGLQLSGGQLVSYDIQPPQCSMPPVTGAGWTFNQADTAALSDIAPTDLLCIDTLHTADQVERELIHAHRVTRYLVFHDVVKFGWAGEQDQPGILHPILNFLIGGDWVVDYLEPSEWGLLVLTRR